MSAVVSVRIPEELKETLKKYGVKVSEAARRALEDEVERRRMEEAIRNYNALELLREYARETGIDVKEYPSRSQVEAKRPIN